MRLNTAKKMTNIKTSKKGVTVVEIVIAATLSCVILGVGMAMMRRSNTQFKKSNDLISIQRLMDNIIERIRTDVRSLKRVVPSDSSYEGEKPSGPNIITEINPNKVSFVIVKYTSDNDNINEFDEEHRFAKITYEYKPDDNSTIDLLDGESYISSNGTKWEHTEEVKNCNICHCAT